MGQKKVSLFCNCIVRCLHYRGCKAHEVLVKEKCRLCRGCPDFRGVLIEGVDCVIIIGCYACVDCSGEIKMSVVRWH